MTFARAKPAQTRNRHAHGECQILLLAVLHDIYTTWATNQLERHKSCLCVCLISLGHACFHSSTYASDNSHHISQGEPHVLGDKSGDVAKLATAQRAHPWPDNSCDSATDWKTSCFSIQPNATAEHFVPLTPSVKTPAPPHFARTLSLEDKVALDLAHFVPGKLRGNVSPCLGNPMRTGHCTLSKECPLQT